jgi:xylulokinase
MQTAGSSIAWIASELFGGSLDELNLEAGASPPGANGVVFLPYLLGERSPRWNPDAKGALIGLKLGNKRGDLARAVLEGVAFNLEIVLSILRTQLPIGELILIGGGAQSSVWRQIIADIYGVRILVPEYLEEATSMGAAIIGGVGTGYFSFEEGARRFIRIEKQVDPNPDSEELYASIKGVFDECYTSLEATMRRL